MKLCDSEWPQADRAVQAVGLAPVARLEDVARQLAQMLPTLRSRDAPDRSRYPPRLPAASGQHRRESALAPWLTSRQRLALRGLMFSQSLVP